VIVGDAQRVYGLRDNAAQLVDRQPLKRSGDFQVLSPSKVEALARAAEFDQDAALFRVAAYTGLRLGELRALRWCDIDFGLRLVHVRRSFTYGAVNTPKSGKVRSVPLIDQAGRALDRLSQARPVHRRRGPRLPGFGGRLLRRQRCAATLQGGAHGRGVEADALPRSPPHVRHHGCAGVPALRREGVHGTRRHQHDHDLHPPRAASWCRGAAPESFQGRSTFERLNA
jgi:integrase